MSTAAPNLQNKFGAVLRSEPKKTIALAVLLTVLAVMLGRFVLGGGNPSPARGSTVSKNTGSAVSSGKTLSTGAGSLRVGAGSAALLKWADAPVPPISRNLFTVRTEFFPVDGSGTRQSDSTDQGFWSSLEKSMARRADQRFKHDTLIANYKAQASELKIQSIVMGPQPRAMVSGQMVTEGNVVAGFRVLKIEARRMIIEREGIRLEIQMK
jgi:hypothetical protein